MIETVAQWREPSLGRDDGPFAHRQGDWPLSITFHTATLQALSDVEVEAVDTLKELAGRPGIKAFQTEPGAFPHLEVDAVTSTGLLIPVTIQGPEGWLRKAGLVAPDQYPRIAAVLAGQEDPQHPDTQTALADLLMMEAHAAFDLDLFVTTSPWLLNDRARPFVASAHPCRPLEAARIVGLLLRARGDYTLGTSTTQRGVPLTSSTNRQGLYKLAVRDAIPSLGRYVATVCAGVCPFSESKLAEWKLGVPDYYLADLAQGVEERAIQALEARDAIGFEFYCRQDDETRARMAYHFGYLTLLLAGALDAQARIAHAVYDVPISPFVAGFTKDIFIEKLAKRDAASLVQVVTDEHFQAVAALVHQLRNTIHGGKMWMTDYRRVGQPPGSALRVPEALQQGEWGRATQQCGSPENWGVIRDHGIYLEPYTYATRLVGEVFAQLDAVAAATDLVGLFGLHNSIPPYTADKFYREFNSRRASILVQPTAESAGEHRAPRGLALGIGTFGSPNS